MDCAEDLRRTTSICDSSRKRIYHALDDTNTQLRLLLIEPGGWSAPLNGTIHTFDLSTAPNYAATSYTWGNPTPVRCIHINGVAVNVRSNCYYALKQARYRKKRNYLWIDSVCINQDDVAEKSARVAQMAKIFSEAEAVYCCVGPHDGDSEWLCQKVELLRKVSVTELPWDRGEEGGISHADTKLPEREWDTFKGSILDNDLNLHRFVAAYNQFCDRSYWQRLWTLQEVVVGRCEEVWCDKCVLKLRLLVQVGWQFAFNRQISLGNQIRKLDDVILFQKHAVLRASDIIDVLCSKRCSDPRDLVYGSLSISRLPLIPDYSKSPGEVAFDAILAFVVAERDKLTPFTSYALHESIIGILKRMGIAAGDEIFANRIQARLKNDETPVCTAGSVVYWGDAESWAVDDTIRKLNSNALGQLWLDTSNIPAASLDTSWPGLSSNSVREFNTIEHDSTPLAIQSVFASDGSCLGVTSTCARPGDLMILTGTFDRLDIDRYLVLHPSDEPSKYEVVGQAATIPLVPLSRSTSDRSKSPFVRYDLDPEDLTVYYVQSLIPPGWSDIDWILRCAAIRFSGPSTGSYIDSRLRYDGFGDIDSENGE